MNSNKVLHSIIPNYLEEAKEWPWLQKKIAILKGDFKDRNFYLAFSACPRFITKEIINFSKVDVEQLEMIYPNFSAMEWSKDELARTLLMTALPAERNGKLLDALFGTADYRELMVLYKGLFFLENAADFTARAREGLRTNMVGVFDAIALHNPFSAKYLSEDAWNQMVLKAVFMNRPIYKIFQIEARKNLKLALIFLDYAHERWSAHRKVTPELWRFISGFVDENFIKDIQKTILGKDKLESIAATKALIESSYPIGHEWLKNKGITTEKLPSWEEIGKRLEADFL